MSVILQTPTGKGDSEPLFLTLRPSNWLFLLTWRLTLSGEKVLFTKGAESSIFPHAKSGEVDKTRLHVDEFALVSRGRGPHPNLLLSCPAHPVTPPGASQLSADPERPCKVMLV